MTEFKAYSRTALGKLISRDKRDLYYLRKVFPYVVRNFHCDSPGQVAMELSNRCNLRCKMCWFHGENGVGDLYKGLELTTQELFGIVDQLALYTPHIYIGGSEPFIREDFLAILNHIRSRNMPVSFTTNGTLLDSLAIKKLVAYGVDEVNFSIDGNEEMHDRIRGRGVFGKVTQSVIKLAEYKKEKACIKPAITVNITITNNLAGRMKSTVNEIRHSTGDAADFYRLHQLWFISRNELAARQSAISRKLGCSVSGAVSHVLPASLISDPTDLADEIMSLGSQPKVTMFPDLQRADIVKYYSERPRFGKRCIAPFFGAVIKPNGDVKFCPDEWIDDYILGNLRSDRFQNLWNSERARKFRKVLLREKSFAGCNRCSWMYSFS
jgi:radical SAM protein with 4Fe4S-binding SPASM domain